MPTRQFGPLQSKSCKKGNQIPTSLDPRDFKPLVAIELDDASHRWSAKQKKSDGVKNDVAAEAGLVMLRFPWQHSYDADVIREKVAAAVNALADGADTA